MGCFSFMCQNCDQPVLSDSFKGERVKLFLLQDGKVIEKMEGEYDSYGRVFGEGSVEERESIKWTRSWDKVCDLMFEKDEGNGITAVHERCFRGAIPTIRSKDDPNQGWKEGDMGYGLSEKERS